MPSMNKVLLLGNLGRDPELRHTTTGKRVVNFSMATSRHWKNQESGEIKEATDWHRVVVWGFQIEFLAEHLKKGSQVHVEGRLHTRSWNGRDGAKRYTTEVIASRVLMLGRRADRKAPEPTDEPESPADPLEPEDTGDIPF